MNSELKSFFKEIWEASYNVSAFVTILAVLLGFIPLGQELSNRGIRFTIWNFFLVGYGYVWAAAVIYAVITCGVFVVGVVILSLIGLVARKLCNLFPRFHKFILSD